MTETIKAKRRIKEYKFDKENHHVALVHSSQGGAANLYTEALVLKSTNDITDEYLEKATMVKVTLPFDDFLEKFFGMWEENADMLTEILGFSDEEDMTAADRAGMSWEEYKAYCEQEREDFIASVEIMKSGKNVADLNAKDFLNVLLTQSRFEEKQQEIEKAFTSVKDASKEKKVETEIELQKAKDANAALQAEVQKAKDDAAKAVAELEVMKAAQASAKEASRKEVVKSVVPEDKVEDTFKSLNVLDDSGFNAVIEVLKAAASKEEDAFKERGLAGDGKDEKEDKVAAILKAKYTPAKQ